MKQLYAPIVFLLLIPFLGYTNSTDNTITDKNPPCTADIITTSQEICDNIFMVSAAAPEAGETGVWTGPAGTSFVDVNNPSTFITNLNPGPNVITWTIFSSNGTPCDVDEITIINSEVQTTPTIITPNNTEVCDENGFQVEAQGPLLPGETGIWSANDPQVTFTNPNGLTTIVNNLVPGNNGIIWTITNGTCSANAGFFTVVNNEVTTQAEIEATSATESCQTDGFSGIFANITNQLVPGEVGTWSGPPGVTFSPNSEAPTIFGLLPGDNVLTWTITRGNCPPSVTTYTLTNNAPENVNININDSDTAACADDALNLSADAPLANQTGMWSGPAGAVFSPNASSTDVSVTGTPPGMHWFYWTLTQGGCSLSDSIQIEIYDEPVGTYSVNPTETVGGNEGSIDICVEGGTAPFSIEWDPATGSLNNTNDPACPGESYNIGGLVEGTYVVTITDANGCFDILGDNNPDGDTITIGGPDCSDFDFGVITGVNESCDESDDGSITIEVLNAEGAILYSVGNVNGIADVTTTENPYTFENLPAGEYNLFISDDRLCTDSYIGNPVIITAPDPLAVTTFPTPILTVGGTEGTIGVCIDGGTGPYTVTWTPVEGGTVGPDTGTCEDNQIITGLGEKEYDVKVVDANGCETIVNGVPIVGIDCMIEVDASSTMTTDVSCNGANDGTITVGGTTDSPPLQYSIDGGMTYSSNPLFENLEPGTYQVFIKDQPGCVAGPTEITITEPDSLMTTAIPIQVSAVGGSDGKIQLCVEGGTPPNTVTWSPSNVGSVGPSTDPSCDGESLTISGLSSGMYTVTVTDANGCINDDIDEIDVPDPACTHIAQVVATDNSCGVNPTNPSFDGTLEVTIMAGADPLPPPPYIISVACGAEVQSDTTNSTTFTFTGLEPCNYIVTVYTPADNCTIGFSGNPVQISAPELLSAPFTITETSTVSGNDGEICVEPMGGTPPYQVFICDQPASQGGACGGYFVGGLMTGDQCNVLVIDTLGCESTGVLMITGPDCGAFSAELDGENGIMNSCDEADTGAINLNVMGGLEPYTFVWNNGATTEDQTGLPGGTYSVTVSDAQECDVIIDEITIETYDPVDLEVGVTINGMFMSGNEFETQGDSLELGFESNFVIDSIIWSPPDGLSDPNSFNPKVLPEETTTYTVTVFTEEGCMATAQITIIAEDIIIVVPTGFTPNGDGENDTFYPYIDGNVDVLGFTVWNRWGEKVFDDPNPPGWDGSYKGVKQPLSSFVYVLEYQLPGKSPEVLKGDFVLIR